MIKPMSTYQKDRLGQLVRNQEERSQNVIISIMQLTSTMFQIWYKNRTSQIVVIDQSGKLSLPKSKCVYDSNFRVNQILN